MDESNDSQSVKNEVGRAGDVDRLEVGANVDSVLLDDLAARVREDGEGVALRLEVGLHACRALSHDRQGPGASLFEFAHVLLNVAHPLLARRAPRAAAEVEEHRLPEEISEPDDLARERVG